MKKIKRLNIFLILAITFNFLNVFADDPNFKIQPSQGSGLVQDCPDCIAANSSDLVKQSSELLKVLDQPFDCAQSDSQQSCLLIDWLKLKHQVYNKNCQGFFLNQEGKVGAFSRVLAELMINDVKINKEQSYFVKNNEQFQKLCPGFDKFTLNQKLAFHGWIFELTAFPENVCTNKNSIVNGVNSKAACMLQLNYPTNMRTMYSKGAKNIDGTTQKNCYVSPKELMTDRGCLSCGFDIYKWHMTKYDGKPFGEIVNDKLHYMSYWASQNPLPPAAEKCYVQNLDAKFNVKKDPKDPKGRPLFFTNCKSLKPNWEWTPRYKFFKRIQKFPLCDTELAKLEIEEVRKHIQNK